MLRHVAKPRHLLLLMTPLLFAYRPKMLTVPILRIPSAHECSNFSKAERTGERPYLGASLRSMLDQPGMMVLMVVTESPAWNANMKVGDVLLEIDGRTIDQIDDYYKAIAGKHG